MCDPITAAIVIGGTLAVGGQVVGTVAEQKAAREQEKALAKEREARLAQRDDALARGADEAGRLRTEGSLHIARQKTALGASGVDPGVGSALGQLLDSRLFSSLDAERARANAFREAWGYQLEADTLAAERTATRHRRQSALVGNLFEMGGTAASTVAATRDPRR